MEIRTLETASLLQITSTFNEAFGDYFIKLQFTEEGMAAKIKTEGIVLNHSIGAFAGEKPVGLVLQW